MNATPEARSICVHCGHEIRPGEIHGIREAAVKPAICYAADGTQFQPAMWMHYAGGVRRDD